MAYILDTNILIRSKNEMPIELWPSFWSKLCQMMTDGHVLSNISVRDEINRGKDELTLWIANNAPRGFFVENDNEVMAKYAEVLNWANGNSIFTPLAIAEFAQVADAYLVATAAAKGYVLVTNESSDPLCRRRVKIPDACNALGVRYCDLNQVLRELGITI